MKPTKARKLASALTSKGFLTSTNDHTFYILYVNGRKTSIRTKISHGKKEYGKSLLGQMSKQLRLEPRQFERLIECPMSEQDYLKHLVDSGHLSSNVAINQ